MYLSYWELSHIIIFCITRTLYFYAYKSGNFPAGAFKNLLKDVRNWVEICFLLFSRHLESFIKIMIRTGVIRTSRSTRPTDVSWPCHALLDCTACLRKFIKTVRIIAYSKEKELCENSQHSSRKKSINEKWAWPCHALLGG